MAAPGQRVGIERKILTSILWVGVLPMIVALITGYIAGRRYTASAIEDTLLTAARKTAEGVAILNEREIAWSGHLAQHASVREALTPDTSGAPRVATEESLRDHLIDNVFSVYASMDNDAPYVVSLYDINGALLLSTDDTNVLTQLPDDWIPSVDGPEFEGYSYDAANAQFAATLVSPVMADDSGERMGYLSVRVGINSLIEFAMGASANPDPPSAQDSYRVVYLGPDNFSMISRLRNEGDGPRLSIALLDEELETALRKGPQQGARYFSSFGGNGDESAGIDVLLAFIKMPVSGLENAHIYLVVYRPTSAVYMGINTAAIVVLLVCALAIAFLCVNAYRDVHNNIVRPVSLLNEGAQIVRQGDFDLKLKIDTGDEIEELATSFNEMAVALKSNMSQLEASEENYRSLVTSMRDGIYRTDADGNLLFLNPVAVDILGFTSMDESMNSDMGALFEEPGGVAGLAQRLESLGDDERARVWLRRKDQRRICVEISCNVTRDSHGMRVGYEGILRDVTRNVRLEEEARERSERISAINQIANVINSSLEAGRLYESLVIELKKLVSFDYASVALLSETGSGFDGRQIWPDEELHPGHTFFMDAENSIAGWVSQEQRSLLIDDLRTDTHSEFATQFPQHIRSCLCVPLYASGRIIGTLNLGSRDIHRFTNASLDAMEQMAPHLAVAIRNAQLLVNLQLSLEEVTRGREKLHAANEELKTLDEMKTNLLSNVSHELRTPLVSVMGYNDMILNGKAGPISATQQEYLQISLRNIEKLVTLIENLLDFSRLHRGDERLIFDTFDLVDCARSSIQIIKPVADSRKIELIMDVPDDDVLVEGDKAKMGQVFNNLLSNAVKFNREGGTVTITMKKAAGLVEVSVADTGIGIPEEALDKVFTRFYQFDASSTRKYGGTGIGLSIAQDIVRLHGSSIVVSSESKKGSTFRFELKLSETDAAHTLPEDSGALPYGDDHLLVELYSEDRPLSVQIRNILFSEGIEMIHATTSDAAVTMAQRHHPDCIVVDLNGSGVTPENTLDLVLQDSFTGTLPIVLLTNDDRVYEKYRNLISARVKRGFRKSSFLSGLHHALSRGVDTGSAPLGQRILCVDDDREIRTFITRCLEGEGYECDTCRSGEEALEKLAEGDYGLVLLDIAMPGLDGWETCRAIREIDACKGVQIYMVSAKPIEHNLSRVKEFGADGFLLKPFRPEDLIQLVQGLELQAAAK